MRSELAAKGIGATSASSAAVSSVVSAIVTTTSAFFTPVDARTSTYTSSTSLAGSRVHNAASVASVAGHAASYHNGAFGTSSSDSGRRPAAHVKGSQSSAAAASLDSTSQYGIDTSASRHHRPYSSSSLSSAPYSSSVTGFSGAGHLHTMSAVGRTYHGSAAGSTYSSNHPSYAGGTATRTSRRDGYDRLPVSRVHHSSSSAASSHPAISRTGAYDRYHRYH